MKSYESLLADYSELVGKRKTYEEEIEKLKRTIKKDEREVEVLIEVKSGVSKIIAMFQEGIKKRVQELVNKILRYIYSDREIEFRLVTEEKRGKTEFKPVIMDGLIERNPEEDEAGGAADLISLGLRIIFRFLERKPSRPVFVLDEPLKFIGSGDMMEKAGLMLKELTDMLGIQFIIVTHDEELYAYADKMWRVTYQKKIGSVVERVK